MNGEGVDPYGMGEMLSDPKVYTVVGVLVVAVLSLVKGIVVPGVTHRERMADKDAMWQKLLDAQTANFTARLEDKEAARVDWKAQAQRSIGVIDKMVPPSLQTKS